MLFLNLLQLANDKVRACAPGHSTTKAAELLQFTPSPTAQRPRHVVYMIHSTGCSSRPVALCQAKSERIVTLALLFNSSQRRRTKKLFWRAGGTRWKMTFNCTSLAESHPIRALYIFPNSGWWGRAYEQARPAGVAMQRDGCLAPEERWGISEQRALIW